jgi:hypothetical protein
MASRASWSDEPNPVLWLASFLQEFLARRCLKVFFIVHWKNDQNSILTVWFFFAQIVLLLYKVRQTGKTYHLAQQSFTPWLTITKHQNSVFHLQTLNEQDVWGQQSGVSMFLNSRAKTRRFYKWNMYCYLRIGLILAAWLLRHKQLEISRALCSNHDTLM